MSTAHQRNRKNYPIKTKEIISNIPKGFAVALEDESIFIHDALVRRRTWTPEW
ncbi:MAG: hypothetical protein WAM14_12765 [Candidatus Nitrosopolaris sp.]